MTDVTDNPLVSIIVRTKDRPQLLKRALQSIAAQTYRPIEVVLVNDGGCDLDIGNLKSILGDVSLNYVRLEKNTGRAHAGNVGIENTKGEYVGFLDDDDEFYPEHVATLALFLKGSDYRVVYANSEMASLSYDHERNRFIETSEGIFSASDFSADILLFENYIPLISILFKSHLLHSGGGFDESFELFEDWDLLIRISSEVPFYHIDKVTSKYTQWSRDYQIAKVDWTKARNYYLRVLTKWSGRRTPEVAYHYYLNKLQVISGQERIIKGLRSRLNRSGNISEHEDHLDENEGGASSYISALKKQLRERDRYIEEIHNSAGWRMLTSYRETVKPVVAPPGTRREKAYGLMLRGVFLLHRNGGSFLFNKVKNVIRRMNAKRNITKESYAIPLIKDEQQRIIDTRVSVVIPTKDAGPDFKYTLEKLRTQKGIKELEIIVVDSGSRDATVAIAEEFGASVYFIEPSDFNHGATRNLGAEKATGEFIVFMSQDVVAAGDFCLFAIVSEMQKDAEIAAASVKQLPRSDADLFSCWQLWYYNNKLLDFSRDRVSFVRDNEFTRLSAVEKRRLVQLDNIFSCFRKDVFDRFRFNRLAYGEDLELGIRLLKEGHKILFFSSIGGVHSHNRTPAYFLKRSCVDTKSLLRLLDCEPIRWEDVGILSMDDLLGHVRGLYQRVKSAVSGAHISESEKYPLDKLSSAIKLSIVSAKEREFYSFPGDKSLDELFEHLMKTENINHANSPVETDVSMNQYFELLDSFFEYLSVGGIEISGGKALEFRNALYKLFAVTSGSNIGNYLFFSERMGRGGNNSYIETKLGQAI